MSVGAIIQARRSSSRLPNKVIKKLPFNSKTTVLQQVIRRVKKSKKINKIIVATSRNKEDSLIANIAKKEGVKCFRGSLNNVLERYYLAAKEFKLTTIVRITSDCPCIDAQVIDFVFDAYTKSNADYATNALHRTFPHATDVEVFSMNALENAYLNAKKDFEKEHVTPYLYYKAPKNLKIKSVKAKKSWHHPDIRLTLDTQEDYALLCVVFDYLYSSKSDFSLKEIINLFKRKPWLKLINIDVKNKNLTSK